MMDIYVIIGDDGYPVAAYADRDKAEENAGLRESVSPTSLRDVSEDSTQETEGDME